MPVLRSPAAELHGELSPNGQFMAFTSDESGRNEVYIQEFPDPTSAAARVHRWWRLSALEQKGK